jgi:tRNA 2-thiouridine synthesizing protein D
MNFAIAVHGDAASSESPRMALRFARAALAKGHRIHRVFFYHRAVSLANSLVVQPQGEPDPAADWALFAAENGIELAVCVAAGLRRGVLSESDADRYERAAANVKAPFQIVGLGQMIEAAIEADRFVTFCA